MSAEPRAAHGSAPLPPPPSLSGAVRSAASDFYFNSWRLVPANLLWGLGLGILYLVVLVFWPAAVILAALLALPVVGIFRLAALIVRNEPVSFRDSLRAWRRFFAPALVVGALCVIVTVVLLVNLFGGLQDAGVIGWAIATLAAWGLVLGWIWLLCFWPLLSDPAREGWGFRGAARGAGYLVLAHPIRLGSLALLILLVLLVSTVLFAALIALSVAFVALVACRYVLPAADRLEARLATAGVPLGPARTLAGQGRASEPVRPR